MRESDKEVRRDVNCDEGLNPSKEEGKRGKAGYRRQYKFLEGYRKAYGVLEPKSSTRGVPHLYRSGPAFVLLGLVSGWE